MSTAPELWRTTPDRLRFVGINCPHCGQTMFPERMVCQNCGKPTTNSRTSSVVKKNELNPVPEQEYFLFATAARMVEQMVGDD